MIEDDGVYSPIGEKRYKELVYGRQMYLDAAKECCDYTIPCLKAFFEESIGWPSWREIKAPYQGIGARGVSNLASKLLMAVTPANVPMFRFSGGFWTAELEGALSEYAESVLSCIKSSGDYAHLYEVWQLLLISGNVLIFDPDDNSNIRVYSLRDYVLKRDRSGNVLEVVLREAISPSVLESDILEQINNDSELPSSQPLPSGFGDTLEVYTYARRQGNFYYLHQECRGVVINGTEGKYPLEGCPFIPIRMYAGVGEDYSRSFVSNYLGDLKSLDALCQGTVEGAAMAAKHIYLVRPDGLTDISDVQNTPNGGVVYGRQDDIGVMQTNKAYDLRMASEEAAKVEKRLSQAFLILDGGIRNAERVTREEIRIVAQELETALGGVYSVMCYAFQLPYIKRKLFKLEKIGLIKPVIEGITPVIVTGFEALGMSGDKERLIEFVQTASQIGGGAANNYIDIYILIKHLAAKMNINVNGLIKTEDKVQAELNATKSEQVQSQIIEKALPAIINNAEELAKITGDLITFSETNTQKI